MIKRPFLILGVASFLSAYAALFLPLKGTLVLIFLAATAGVAAFCVRRHRAAALTALACAGVVLAGTMYAVKEITVVRPQLAYAGNTVYAVMRVKEQIADGRAYYAEVESGDLPQGVRLCLWVDEATEEAALGDLFAGEIALEAAYDEDTAYREQSAKAYGAYLYAWPRGDGLTLQDGRDSLSLWDTWIYATRRAIHESLYASMPAREAALCESMMIGERGDLPDETQDAFRESGVYHLLVVSGLHLSLLTGVVLSVLQALRVKRLPRLAITMVAVLIFAALCGFSMSILRSMWMVLLSLTALLIHRRGDGLNSLSLAAFVMILFDPFCVADIGWQLSFTATLGMVGLMPAWQRDVTDRLAARFPRLRRVTVPLSTTIGAAVCATLLTQPLTTVYFEELSLLFLPANLVCVPLSTAVIELSFLAALCGPLFPPLADELYLLVQWLSGLLHDWAALLASAPWSSVAACLPHVIVWLFALPLTVIVAYRKAAMRGVIRMTALMVCVLCLSHTAFAWMHRGVSVVAVGGTSSVTALVKTDEGSGLLCTADAASLSEAEELLRTESVRSLSFVLVFPSEDKEPLAWFEIPVDHLVLSTAASSYASLPQAAETSVLSNSRALAFASNGRIERESGAFYLRLGETSVLLCDDACDVETIPLEWQACDLLLLNGGTPKNSRALTVDRVVIFASHTVSRSIRDGLPHRFEEVWMAKLSEPPVFLTRGAHDLLLRSY